MPRLTRRAAPRPAAVDADFARELTAAAARDELVVHYQPVLSLPAGRCTAVEALVRWQHPTRGLLAPDRFIPVAERIGAIGEIGAFVLRRSCADAATWRAAHPTSPLALHVNVSALQLDDARFLRDVTACLAEFDVPPNALVLELTTTAGISSSPGAIQLLGELAALGLVLAIHDGVGDDGGGGVGGSALTALRTVPVRIVKIDGSCVARSTENGLDRAATAAVVTMATAMGLRSIAAGVENADQQAFLESIGADGVQGYLYQRPVPADAFATWLDAHLAALPPVPATEAVVLPFQPRALV